MTADAIIRETDRAIEMARRRLKSQEGLLSRMDREIWPKMRALIRWERLSKEDADRIEAHYTEVRTALFASIQESKMNRNVQYHGG